MAKQANYNSDDHVSESFEPQTSFIVQVDNAPSTDMFNVEFQATNLPESGTWLKAPGSETLSGDSATVANGSTGFRYRVRRTGGMGNDRGVEVYWDNVTSLRSVYN